MTSTETGHSSWQEYMDEDRTFFSVNENAILGGKDE